jgi:F-type H+-transporting ATPase subunit a
MDISNPLEQFQLVPIVQFSLGDADLSFTNSAFFGFLSIGFFVLGIRLVLHNGNGQLVPTRMQTLFETLYETAQSMVSDNVGPNGKGYFHFVFAIFTFILMIKIIGMVPYSFTVTSHLIVTLFLAMIVYIGINIVMIRQHGFHTMSFFYPAGCPLGMLPALVLIEVISHLMKVISLSVRLFANMMSGHILLKVLLGFAWTMMMSGGIGLVLHILPMLVVFLLLFLETAVALIQAYVFATLTTIYLNESLHLH